MTASAPDRATVVDYDNTSPASTYGPLGRLGGWTAEQGRVVLLAGVVIAVGFGI
jgi:hypothetical protein